MIHGHNFTASATGWKDLDHILKHYKHSFTPKLAMIGR
jgi:hypothetical protein